GAILIESEIQVGSARVVIGLEFEVTDALGIKREAVAGEVGANQRGGGGTSDGDIRGEGPGRMLIGLKQRLDQTKIEIAGGDRDILRASDTHRAVDGQFTGAVANVERIDGDGAWSGGEAGRRGEMPGAV